MTKSYNQMYKDSGTTLSYKDWRKREDEKMASFSGIESPAIKDSTAYKAQQADIAKITGFQTDTSNKTVFGINKYVIIIGGILIVSAIGYTIYKNRKQ